MKSVLKGLRVAAILLALFFASQMLAALVLFLGGGSATALAVVGPHFRPQALSSSVSIQSWEPPVVEIALAGRPAVGDLYRAGALLVLPVRAGGCLSYAGKR